MSQPTNQPIPSGSYQQEYHTIVINTPISRPVPNTTSDGESCPPFIEPSFIQGFSPASTTSKFSQVSNLPSIPLPINLTHQEELFKWLQDLPIQGYLTSTTNPDKWPKVRLPKTEPVSMYELHNMLNNPDWQHIFIDAINLIGSYIPWPFELLVALWSLYQYNYQTRNGSRNPMDHHQEPFQKVATPQYWQETPIDYHCRTRMNTSRNEEWLQSFGLRTIWNIWTWIWTSSSLGIYILLTIMINIACHPNHYI